MGISVHNMVVVVVVMERGGKGLEVRIDSKRGDSRGRLWCTGRKLIIPRKRMIAGERKMIMIRKMVIGRERKERVVVQGNEASLGGETYLFGSMLGEVR